MEKYVRQPDDHWLYSRTDGLDTVLVLEALRCGLPLAEVYARVTFAQEELGITIAGEHTT